MLRHYADKTLPFGGAKLFKNYKNEESGDYHSCFVCPLYLTKTCLHLLPGKGTKYYDTYYTNFIILPDSYLLDPKLAGFKHRIFS
jgi:hypothetical protein